MFGTLRDLIFVLVLGLATVMQDAVAANCEKSWLAWDVFKKNLISKEGRVIDSRSDDLRSTSAGQADALFFALVANDRVTFDKLLEWTETHLAQGDLTAHLPSAKWGKTGDGEWAVLDADSAPEADLWMAYALGEAGRLWNDRRYVALASVMANRLLNEETAMAPKLGLVLLPASTGSMSGTTSVRLNPGHVPWQLVRWFVEHGKDPRWASLLVSTRQLMTKSAPNGYVPDWTVYDYSGEFRPDKGAVGSIDSMRVYLWAGMLNHEDADSRFLTDALKPMALLVEKKGAPPLTMNVITGVANASGSSGFSAALLPLLQTFGLKNAVEQQRRRLEARPIATDQLDEQILSLFALGWMDNFYHFDSNGNTSPVWTASCQ